MKDVTVITIALSIIPILLTIIIIGIGRDYEFLLIWIIPISAWFAINWLDKLDIRREIQ